MYGAAEMFLSPEVGIVQHSTGVMQVSHDYFENGITYFTNLVYSSIRFSIGSGEVAPFVGHNAFLRWKCKSTLMNSHKALANSFSQRFKMSVFLKRMAMLLTGRRAMSLKTLTCLCDCK